MAARPGRGADPMAVLDRAKLKDALEVRAGHGEPSIAPSCRHQEPAIRNLRPAVQTDDSPPRVDAPGASPQPEGDISLAVKTRGVDELIPEPLLPAKVPLRQGRPVVRQLGL